MLPAVHYNGRAKEPKEEVGVGLAWETKLIGDCKLACEALLVRFYGLPTKQLPKAYNSRISAV